MLRSSNVWPAAQGIQSSLRFKMIVKTHKTSDGRKILAICDDDLIGKKFEEKNVQLDLTSGFYNGEKRTESEIEKMFDDAYIVNMVGKNSVELGKKAGIVSEENIIYVKKIPHSQTVLF